MPVARAEVRGTADPIERRMRRLLRAARALGLLTVGLLTITAFTPLSNVVARSLAAPDSPRPVDAIVALASNIQRDGALNEPSLRRLVRAMELYAEGLAPLLVLSGAHVESGLDEGAVRAALARRLGVPQSAIVTVTGPRSTREEALAIEVALQSRGVHRLLVVTDWDHAERARATFERVGFEVRVAVTRRPADAASTPKDRLRLGWDCARSLLALAYYRLLGFA
jgi:uncharacterized SAM-binding protein YcdF (DUF218 family)